MKVCLLHSDRDFDFGRELPAQQDALSQDLELDTVLGAMAGGDKFLLGIARKVVLASLTEPAEILYRQQVLADCISQPAIIRQMYAVAVAALEDKRGLWGYSSQYPSSILSGAVAQVTAAIVRLRELRQIADAHAGTFRSRGLSALLGTLQRELDDEYFNTLSGHLKQLRFRDGELISAQLGRDNGAINLVLRSGGPRRKWKERVGLEPRSAYSFTIPPRDDAAAQALADITGRGINLVANALAQSADHVTSFFTVLRAELGFYVACLNLHEQLTASGQPVTFPQPAGAQSRALTCTDLRDTALALRTGQVTGNDVDADGMSLVVITGANSGGKSTFLRSAGLAQLLMQCGMFATAAALRASVCTGIFTHFIREEDPAMVSGRLDEELSRMSVIADQVRPHGLVLFNESFAATNEREGSEIGRQVVTALLEAGIRVLFVTHLYDFAESFHRGAGRPALFLRAPRQPDGRRDFRLIPAGPLPTSFGQDLYFRIGGWLGERDSEPEGTPAGLPGGDAPCPG